MYGYTTRKRKSMCTVPVHYQEEEFRVYRYTRYTI